MSEIEDLARRLDHAACNVQAGLLAPQEPIPHAEITTLSTIIKEAQTRLTALPADQLDKPSTLLLALAIVGAENELAAAHDLLN